MLTYHQILTAVARCVSLLQRYQEGDLTSATKAMMIAEVDVLVGWLLEVDLGSGQTEVAILRLVQEHLLDSYGPEEGGKLNEEFVEAFRWHGILETIDYQNLYVLYKNQLIKIGPV